MAETAQQQPQQQQQDAPQQETQQKDQLLPPLEVQAPTTTAQDGQGRGRNEELEVALRRALESSPKDLGGLCKVLGEAFCLPSSVPPRAAGYDSGSDTTAPADQEQSSSSESGACSETGGDGSGNAIVLAGASGSASSGGGAGAAGGKEVDRNVRALADAAEIPANLLATAWNTLLAWREALSEGDLLDVFNSTEGEWYLGKVVPLLLDESAMEVEAEVGDGEGAGVVAGAPGAGAAAASGAGMMQHEHQQQEVRIHYQGWPNKYDETFARDSFSLQPVHTHTKQLKKPERKKKRAKEVTEWVREDEFGNIVARGIVGEDDPYDDEADADRNTNPGEEGVSTNRFGRKLVPRINLASPKDRARAKACTHASDGDGGDGGEGGVDGEGQDGGEGSKGKKRTNRTAFGADGGGGAANHDDWICSTCWQLDTPCMSDIVACDGPCQRSFHVVCLDVDEEALSREKWLCEDCERGEHACWQCGDEGQDNVMGGVFRCSVGNCGRFYHRHCVELNSNTNIRADLDEGEDGHPVFKFRCGYHTCDTCNSKSGASKNHLYKCFKCPVSYHINCIPPDARYHEFALLCGDHPEDELPALKQEDSVLAGQGDDDNLDGGSALGTFRLPPLKLPRGPPSGDNKSDLRHFRLPMSILTSYHSKPPPFQHICAMQFVAPRPPRMDPSPACICTDGCGDSCLNFMLRTECVCGSGIRAKYQNCKQGPNCGNRSIQSRVTAKVATFREYGMGWGLKVVEDVAKGSLVGEYVGEVIDEAMVEHRMSEQRRLRPNDGEFYIMELGQSLFVDAKEKGNLMRLINHSCNPNCDVQAWNIAGYTRLGIYAKKDLVNGESLSYDYKFSTNETARFRCMCGADNCRGTLAPKSREDEVAEDGSKLKGKARREMLQKRERQSKNRQARSQQGQLVTSKRLSLTGRGLPGDRTAEVKAGPPAKYFGFARDQRIFLVRNARAGADLLTRKRLLVTKAKVQARKAALAPPPPPPPPSRNAPSLAPGDGSNGSTGTSSNNSSGGVTNDVGGVGAGGNNNTTDGHTASCSEQPTQPADASVPTSSEGPRATAVTTERETGSGNAVVAAVTPAVNGESEGCPPKTPASLLSGGAGAPSKHPPRVRTPTKRLTAGEGKPAAGERGPDASSLAMGQDALLGTRQSDSEGLVSEGNKGGAEPESDKTEAAH